MIQSEKFSISNRVKSFGYAIAGIGTFFKTEHNARIHFLASVLAISGGFYFSISRFEWVAILSAIAFVIVSEMLNTALEKLADVFTLEQDIRIKMVKDVAAGAVLIAAFYSLLIAALVFVPKII
jgi:diacylglycerol kinase (ATP)